MTWTINAGVELAIRENTYTALSTSIGVAVVALLVVLLLLRDVRHIGRRPGDRDFLAVIDVLLGPLLIAFPVLVVARLLILLG